MHILPLVKYLFALLLFCCTLSATANESLLQDFKGNAASLDEHIGKGKWLLVMYWASDCHVCNVEAKNYEDFHIRHADKGAAILGVSLDGAAGIADAEQFIKRHELTFPNLIGEPDLVALQYTSTVGDSRFGTPSFLLYDPQGELKAAQLGVVRVEKIEAFIESHSKVSAN